MQKKKNEAKRISEPPLSLKENRNAMDGIISTRFENNLTVVSRHFLLACSVTRKKYMKPSKDNYTRMYAKWCVQDARVLHLQTVVLLVSITRSKINSSARKNYIWSNNKNNFSNVNFIIFNTCSWDISLKDRYRGG